MMQPFLTDIGTFSPDTSGSDNIWRSQFPEISILAEENFDRDWKYPATRHFYFISPENSCPHWAAAGNAMRAQVHTISDIDRLPRLMAATQGASLILRDWQEDMPGGMELAALEAAARQWQCPLILVVSLQNLDTLVALGPDQNALLLCEPDEPAMLAGLIMAFNQNNSWHRPLPLLRDSANEQDGTHLARLSLELERLSSLIEWLVRDTSRPSPPPASGQFAAPRKTFRPAPTATHPPVTAQGIRALLRARRMRDQFLPGDLFADPAWDIVLDLMAARLEGIRVSVSSLCIAASVPPTTALRWIKQLTDQGLLERQADDEDGRRVFISLSPQGVQAVEQWFQACRDMLQNALR
jgi:DNA-binding transcriptional ArsR family regulator